MRYMQKGYPWSKEEWLCMIKVNGEHLWIHECDAPWMALMEDPVHLVQSAMISLDVGKGIRSLLM